MVYTNEIIERVKMHPVLFNTSHPDYKSKRVRDLVWEQLASELNESRNELRKKWKNIRDCYKKYLRSVSPGGSVILRSYKNWQWAECMEFCKPYIFMSDNETNNTDPENIEEIVESDDQFFECAGASAESNPDQNILGYIENPDQTLSFKNTQSSSKRDEIFSGLDATDLIFLGYSSIIKSFTPTRQAIIKMKIAQVIMEEELQHAENLPFEAQSQTYKLLHHKSPSKNNAPGEISVDNGQADVAVPVEPTKQKRGRKRKIKNTSVEDVQEPVAVETNGEEITVVKTELKDIPYSETPNKMFVN